MPGRAVDRRWPRAASSRRGSAWGRSAARPAGGRMREVQVRGLVGLGRADRPSIGAGDHARAPAQRPQREALGVQPDGTGEVVLVGGEAASRRPRRPELVEAACLARAGQVGVGEEALLDGGRGRVARLGRRERGRPRGLASLDAAPRGRGSRRSLARSARAAARRVPRPGAAPGSAWRWFLVRCRCSGCRRRLGG